MFQHIGMLTLAESATDADRAAIADGLNALPGQIDGLVSATVVLDAKVKADSADLLFVMTFETRAAWEAYGSHPAHVAVVQERIVPVLAAKTFVQADGGDVRL